MAFGGRPFWRQPGNRRDSNKCRSGVLALLQRLRQALTSWNSSRTSTVVMALQVRPLATLLVVRLHRQKSHQILQRFGLDEILAEVDFRHNACLLT